jgi:hypothetical protein
MNDADIDRTLRAWLAAGSDAAPERFVWHAMDAIEDVPQRPPWVTALEGARRPVMPIVRVAAVAAVLLVAVSLFLTVGSPNDGQLGGPAPYATEDLVRIVAWEDTAPPRWSLDSLITTPTDVLTIPVRSMDGDQWSAQEELEEYLGGRYTDFSGDDAVFISWALVFRTDRATGEAFDLYREELLSPDGWGLSTEKRIGLGEEAVVLSGETTALMGSDGGESVPMQIYLWRSDNVLMATAGWFDFDPDELRSVADGMDARAQQTAGAD